MSDSVSDLAAKSGLSPDQAQKGLGAVLSFVKESLPAETFAQVSAAVPGSDEMMAAAGPQEDSGGVLGSLKGMAGKLFGGGGPAALIARLSSLGISVEQMQSFLPRVMEFLKDRLPESVTKQLSGLLPNPEETSA
jgi:uncharacterized protein (DUF2267 family)